jgi:hypothetical protein
MHEHVVNGHPLGFHVAIGDECPVTKFCDQWLIPTRFVFPLDMPESDFRDIVIRLASMAQSGMKLFGAPLYDALGGAAEVISACESFTMKTEDIMAPEIHKAEDAANVDYGHLPDLAIALKREAKRLVAGAEIISRVEVAANGLTLYRRSRPNDKIPEHLIWLDATANQRLYETVFRRPCQVAQVYPQMRGRFFQLYQRAYGKGAVWSKKEAAMRAKSVNEAVDCIKLLIRKHGYQTPGVITFKDLEPHIIKEIPGAIVGHFYSARGTNQFEPCDGLFILGTPQPEQGALPDQAKMLYFERDEPFNVTWSERRAPYNYVAEDGQGRDYPVSGYWSDRDLHEVLASTRDEEIVQAVHRSRPLHRQADVWLLTNVPHESLPLAGLYTYAEAMGAPILSGKDAEAPGYNVFQWPRIVEVAEAAYIAKGYVEANDFEGALKVSRPTALLYLKIMAEQPDWEYFKAVRKNEGRPPLLVSRRA